MIDYQTNTENWEELAEAAAAVIWVCILGFLTLFGFAVFFIYRWCCGA